MVASIQTEISFFRGIGRRRERGFGALAQVIGRTANTKYVNTKRVGADLLESAPPEIAEVVSRGKNFKTAAKSVRRQTLEKTVGQC